MPDVLVNFRLDLNDPKYYALNYVGGSVLIPNEGYKGVIITRTDFEQFAAYDGACTYDPTHEWGRVVPDGSGINAKDTVCGSSFMLLYGGYVVEGPAGIPLKMYVVDYNMNSNFMIVHN